MKARKRVSGICLGLSLVIGSAMVPTQAENKIGAEQVAAAVAAAKQALKRANQAGFEWRDSGKMVKEAERLSAKGVFEQAMKLAAEAQRQGEDALAQSRMQANAGPRLDEFVRKARIAEYEIAAADAARKTAGKMGFEWRDTGKMIKKAKQAALSYQYDKAIKLARAAKKQGENGQYQAIAQRNAGPRF